MENSGRGSKEDNINKDYSARCPLCKEVYSWTGVNSYSPTEPCPKCKETLKVMGWEDPGIRWVKVEPFFLAGKWVIGNDHLVYKQARVYSQIINDMIDTEEYDGNLKDTLERIMP